MTKTMRHILRRVFGYKEGILSSPISNWGMPVVPNTRDWKAAKELEETGVVQVYKRNNGLWYVRMTMHPNGEVPKSDKWLEV